MKADRPSAREQHMARPRKQDSTNARQQLLNAFWELLEDRRLHDLTVGALASRAHCNRGTFYYHFSDFDNLVFTAIENEFMQTNGVADDIFNLITEADEGAIERIVSGQQMKRLLLLMKRGGTDMLEATTKIILLDLWRTVLCPDGSELAQETRFVIEYAINGMLGILSYKCRKEEEKDEPLEFPFRFAKQSAAFTVSQISEAQGVPKEEVLMRLKMLKQLIGLKNEQKA